MSKFIKLPDDVRERVENEVEEVRTKIIMSEMNGSNLDTTSSYFLNELSKELREQKALGWFREQELLAQIEQLKKQIR